MSWTNIITVPLIATIVSLYVGVHVLRCHKAKGAVPLAIMFFAGAQWSLGYAFELICVGLDAKIFWDNVQFLGSTLLFPAIFIFVLQYTDHEGGLRHWGRFLLVMEPAATNVLAWTNPLHGLIRRNAALDAGGPFTLLTYDWGPWLWVSVAYGIFLLALPSMIMLAVRFMRTPPRLRSQIGMILLGVLIPWVGGILTVSGLFPAPVQHLDLTPLTFTMGCLLISWGLFRYRLFQFRPATYETIIAHVMDGVVVLDMQKQVVELNPAAEQLLDLPATRILERPITDLLPGYTVQQHPTECVLGQGEARRYVEVYTSTLGDTSRALNGWLLVLHDITEGKHIEAALRESEAKYRSVAEQANDGIVILQGGLFTYCNAQFAGMLGYAVDDLVGAPFTQVLTLEYRETVARHHGRRIQGAEDVPSHYEVEALHRDGRHIVVEINAGLMVYEGRPASLGIVRDITERKRAEAALRESEEKFRLLVETSTDVIWTLDEAQHFTYVSPAIMELRGLTPEEALQESLADAICPEFLPRITESYAKSAAHHAAGKTGFIDRIEIQQPCKDGGRVWVEVVTRELYDEAGNRTGVLGISRNISARKQMEAELIRAKEAAESANRAKSIFLANMSHELRTPLNIVLGYTGLMSHDPQLTREQRENLEIIVRNGEHLLALINDVLDLSKIEAGKVAVRPEIFDLCELLEGLRELFHVRAQQKGLEVRLRTHSHACAHENVCAHENALACDVPRFIRADAGKLRQVLINLLDNAVKFTDTGRITLDVRADAPDGATGASPPDVIPLRLHFAVEDTGVGIAPEELHQVFAAFEQTESGRQSRRGAGLGLAISRDYVRLMGGEMTVASETGVGTRFSFDLPVEAAPPTRRITRITPERSTHKRLGVGFVAAPQAAHKPGAAIPGAAIPGAAIPGAVSSALSAQRRADLIRAAEQADFSHIAALISEVEPLNPSLAWQLSERLHDFDYQGICDLLADTAPEQDGDAPDL